MERSTLEAKRAELQEQLEKIKVNMHQFEGAILVLNELLLSAEEVPPVTKVNKKEETNGPNPTSGVRNPKARTA